MIRAEGGEAAASVQDKIDGKRAVDCLPGREEGLADFKTGQCVVEGMHSLSPATSRGYDTHRKRSP